MTRPRVPRVIVVVDQFPLVSQTFVVDHIRGLAAGRWQVIVAARRLDPLGETTQELDRTRVQLRELSAPSIREPARRIAALVSSVGLPRVRALRSVSVRGASYFAPSLRRMIDDVQPDLIHAHFSHNGLLAAIAADGRVPVIANFHGYDVLQLPLREGWRPFRTFLDDCHGVVHSTFLEDHVGQHLSTTLHRVTMGVDGELFAATERGPDWRRPLALLTVGRLVIQKGHHVAIEALSALRARSEELDPRLMIVGDGPEREHLQDLANRRGVGPFVQFLGPQPSPRVAQVMAEADVLLVPSIVHDGWQESFCRVAVEGMSAGLAVIGTTTGGLAETIGDGGAVVPPDDPSGLAAAVESLVGSESPSSVARRARRRAEDFTIEAMWEDYGRVAEQIAGEASPPGWA